jgi:hypothetical protein
VTLAPDVAEFRAWAGAGSNSVTDTLVQGCLAEAVAGLAADLGEDPARVAAHPAAAAIAHGEILRRAARLLARRNSPESIAGAGELGPITIPSRDPDSARAVFAIQALLGTPMGVA